MVPHGPSAQGCLRGRAAGGLRTPTGGEGLSLGWVREGAAEAIMVRTTAGAVTLPPAAGDRLWGPWGPGAGFWRGLLMP